MTDFMALSLASLVRSRGFVGVSMEISHRSPIITTTNTLNTLFIGKIIKKNQEINILFLLQIDSVVEN